MSGSESDEEYVPGEPEKLSEEDSADDETELQYEKELDLKIKKRKASEDINAKKKIKTRGHKESTNQPLKVVEKPVTPINPEEEKKREDDLWAKFLEGTNSKPKPVVKENNCSTSSGVMNKLVKEKTETKEEIQNKNKYDAKARERRIFEFAGETIVVENNVIQEKIKANLGASSKIAETLPRSKGGLSTVLGHLSKNNKLTTLEKSKLDWDTYKKEQDIEDEIQSHNKGKEGYLDRQDFLERADYRQYEIERDLRLSRRSNR